MYQSVSNRPHTTKVKRRLVKKYYDKAREDDFILDGKTSIKEDYEPFNDQFLTRFFDNWYVRKDLRRTGMVGKRGTVVERLNSGFNSGIWERTIRIPSLIYNKGDNPGKSPKSIKKKIKQIQQKVKPKFKKRLKRKKSWKRKKLRVKNIKNFLTVHTPERKTIKSYRCRKSKNRLSIALQSTNIKTLPSDNEIDESFGFQARNSYDLRIFKPRKISQPLSSRNIFQKRLKRDIKKALHYISVSEFNKYRRSRKSIGSRRAIMRNSLSPKAKINTRSIYDNPNGLFKYRGAFFSPYMKDLEWYQKKYLQESGQDDINQEPDSGSKPYLSSRYLPQRKQMGYSMKSIKQGDRFQQFPIHIH